MLVVREKWNFSISNDSEHARQLELKFFMHEKPNVGKYFDAWDKCGDNVIEIK